MLDFCLGYHWQLTAAQPFPVPLAMKQESPLAAALSSHPSPIVQMEMQVQFTPHILGLTPEHTAVQPSTLQMRTTLVEALLLKELSTCSVLCQKNGLTIELLTEKKRNAGNSLICLLVLGMSLKQTNKQSSVTPEIWGWVYYFSVTAFLLPSQL